MVQLVRDHYQTLLKGVTPTAVAVEGVAGDTTLGLRRKQGSSFELTHNQTTLHFIYLLLLLMVLHLISFINLNILLLFELLHLLLFCKSIKRRQ